MELKRSRRFVAEPHRMDEARAHLVFLRPDGLVIVKRPDADWRSLQEEYSDYMASLGPWTADEIVEHFALDYGEEDARWPFTRQSISEFMRSPGSSVLECRPDP